MFRRRHSLLSFRFSWSVAGGDCHGWSHGKLIHFFIWLVFYYCHVAFWIWFFPFEEKQVSIVMLCSKRDLTRPFYKSFHSNYLRENAKIIGKVGDCCNYTLKILIVIIGPINF